jgi:CRP/FNR family transcriptional regulator
MDPIRSIISETPLFSGLSGDQLRQIQSIAIDRWFERGEPVFWEGDQGNGFYIVAEGSVKVYKMSLEGKEQILHLYGPGNPVGEVPVFAGNQFPANAQAMVKSRLLFFPRDAFIALITTNPSLALNMLAVLSIRLRQFTVQIENLSLKEVPGRLASYLLYLIKEQTEDQAHGQGGAMDVRLPVSKGQLASLLGTIPETLSRIFSKMTAQGIITVQGADISINDPAALEDLSVSGRFAG